MELALIAIGLTLVGIWIAYRSLRRPISQIVFDEKEWTFHYSDESQVMSVGGRIIITTRANGTIRKDAKCKLRWGGKTQEMVLTKWGTHLLLANTTVFEFQAKEFLRPDDSSNAVHIDISLVYPFRCNRYTIDNFQIEPPFFCRVAHAISQPIIEEHCYRHQYRF